MSVLVWCGGIYMVQFVSQFSHCICLFIAIYISMGFNFVKYDGLYAGLK